MGTITAVFENGVFRPTGPVDLPEGSTVRLQAEPVPPADLELTPDQLAAQEEVYRIMSRRYRSGYRDTAERHNEHQP